jgi:small subunit ribosomal protein S26e
MLLVPFPSLMNPQMSVVRVRSREGRRNRAPPPRIRWGQTKKVNPAVAAAEGEKGGAKA